MSARVKPTGRIILVAAIGALVAGALGVAWLGADQEGFRAAARFTARWSLLWFLAAWSASALAALWAGGWRGALLYNRRGVGLGFATAHIIHAGFFITAIVMGAPTSLTGVVGGGVGYVFVLAMALTSHDYWVRALTPKGWNVLHTAGASVIAFIFGFTYLGALGTRPLIAAIGLGLLSLVLLLKLTAWAKRRAPRPT